MDASVPVCVPCERCSLNATTWIGLPVAKELNPSQSSSMLLQVSAMGGPGVQVWVEPLTQLSTVRVQAPTPHVVVPSPSSTDPSQSSSTPLQISAVGVPGVQVRGTPPEQLFTV